MEIFGNLVNDWQLLTNVTKSSVFDAAWVLNTLLNLMWNVLKDKALFIHITNQITVVVFCFDIMLKIFRRLLIVKFLTVMNIHYGQCWQSFRCYWWYNVFYVFSIQRNCFRARKMWLQVHFLKKLVNISSFDKFNFSHFWISYLFRVFPLQNHDFIFNVCLLKLFSYVQRLLNP